MSTVDDSLVADFITESREHLDGIEPDLLELEQQGEHVSQEIVNRVFRAIHSIKGGASFLAFEALKELSHAMENVLMLVRNGRLKASAEVVDPLLRAVDILRVMLDDIGNSDAVPIQDEVALLNGILSAHDGKPRDQESPKTGASITPKDMASELLCQGVTLTDKDALTSCLRDGMRFFYVAVEPQSDMTAKKRTAIEIISELNSVGKCLATSVDMKRLEANEVDADGFHAMAATVLEADMLSMGIGIPEDRIDPIPVDVVRAMFLPSAEQTDVQKEGTPVTKAAEPSAPSTPPLPAHARRRPSNPSVCAWTCSTA